MGMSTKAYGYYKNMTPKRIVHAKTMMGVVAIMRAANESTTIKTVMDKIGLPRTTVNVALKDLVEMELLTTRNVHGEGAKSIYEYIINEKGVLPADWTPKVMKEMAQKKIDEVNPPEEKPEAVPEPVAVKADENVRTDWLAMDNALSKAMAKEVHIQVDDVDAYNDFIRSMQHVDARTQELKDIVADCIKLATRRVSEAVVPCPACGKGNVGHRGVTGAVCNKCKANADSGVSFELSLKMIAILKGVKQ